MTFKHIVRKLLKLTTMIKNQIFFFFLLIILFSCKDKENKNAETKCPKKFETFFKQFGTDKSFQLNHIKFPLSYSFPSVDYMNTIDSVIYKKDFQFINFSEDEKAMQSEFDKYEILITKIKEDKIIYKRQGYDNGIFISYEFVWINKCWTMVKILDQST